MFQAASKVADWIKDAPEQARQQSTPFEERFGLPLYQYYTENPKKGARFARAMVGVTKRKSYFFRHGQY